ncbi:acetylxylan esterase [Leifsonia sp. TF02-11]|uniref:acetylxylan esterase n=1 Tax=Leifsonia sp. TF02-11 TaxID=2815212 RepID=UPI001AA0D95A|nr:acetylxylan esterase [Leifsonia sp. TF02-11]MBO1739312.1 acetylxylan esterase [Leifsonia sp. TF02-11]
MPRFDLSPAELREYRPAIAEPADFDAFWQRTLDEARSAARPPLLTRTESSLTLVEVYDVTFSGFGGDPIRAWILAPAGAAGPLPAVVEYVGYGGGRSLPHERLAWVNAGYVWAVMDTRGQGSAWGAGGATPDPHGAGPSAPGFVTRGIQNPDDYYYRRVFTDAVLLIDALRSLDLVDPLRVAVTGTSQGGGIAIASAGLSDELVAVMPDVPFLCHFERAVGMTASIPYGEIVTYLAVHHDQTERVFSTLSYFDGANFATRITAPALYSVGLMDQTCPPSTVYAAANRHPNGADVVDYPFNQHEGGRAAHWPVQAAWLRHRLERLEGEIRS